MQHCHWGICFWPLLSSGQKFFGYSEFLTGLALVVIAWTTADVRYRFRVRTAPLPLIGIAFSTVAIVGGSTLLTDLWRAEEWLVPAGHVLTPGSWQAVLGGLFFINFLAWSWFGFIRPPAYGKSNAKRFSQELYRILVQGSPADLSVVASELARSAKPLIKFAPGVATRNRKPAGSATAKRLTKVECVAHDLLLLIADKRFCKAIVEGSPVTAYAFFADMSAMGKYPDAMATFAQNLVNEAISNKDSFLYHEVEGYYSGLIGYHKPVSQALFSDARMTKLLDRMLDPAWPGSAKWDADQWQTYSRVVLMVLKSHVDQSPRGGEHVLNRAMTTIRQLASEVHKVNGIPEQGREEDEVARLRVAVDFVVEATDILDHSKEKRIVVRVRMKGAHGKSLEDALAEMIFEIVFAASTVATPSWRCWSIQHNLVWDSLFGSLSMQSSTGRIVRFKARRLIYDEIVEMKKWPNFKGARMLGICLNVMGLVRSKQIDRESRPLHAAVLAWAKSNFAWLYAYNPSVAEVSLVDGITYDSNGPKISKVYPIDGMRRKPYTVELGLVAYSESSINQ